MCKVFLMNSCVLKEAAKSFMPLPIWQLPAQYQVRTLRSLSSSTASPTLRTTIASRTPASRTTSKQAATNPALLLASGSKRKLMTDYSTEERLNEYADSNLDLLIKLDELKEKSRRDDSHSLELMKA